MGARGQRTRAPEREHSRGRYVARERVHKLLDPDTFMEFGSLVTTPAADGASEVPTTFVCGLGEIEGRPVAIGAEDFTVQMGGMGTHLSRFKMAFGGFLEELALELKVPLVLLLHGVGGSIAIQEAKGYPTLVSTMDAYPVFDLLDRVPVVAAVMGPAAGASAARAVATPLLDHEPSARLPVRRAARRWSGRRWASTSTSSSSAASTSTPRSPA